MLNYTWLSIVLPKVNKMKYIYRVLVLVVVFSCIQSTSCLLAQTITPANIGKVKIDDLTDAQLLDLMQQAQASGMSDAQLRSMAITKGMSGVDADKLQTRINTLRNNNPNLTVNPVGQPNSRQLNYIPQANNKVSTRDTTKMEVFGADLFNTDNLTFEPNLRIATPQNYVLGPDDQVIISVYGNSQVEWKPNVSPDGTIQIPGVGPINIGGKTIEQARGMITSKLKANHYAIGNGTNVTITLGNIRSISVTLTGEVQKQGTYTISSLSKLFNALYVSGGPTDNGSLRQVKLIRNNQEIKTIDFYDFLLTGSQKDNIRLQDGDVIRVPTYKVRVALSGQVKHPAIFEVLPGETLKNVINFAGGFTDQAYTQQ